MKNESKFLKITMHDNDFTGSYEIIGNTIKDILFQEGILNEYDFENREYTEGVELTEDDLPKIKEYIEDIWYGIFQLGQACRDIVLESKVIYSHSNKADREYFNIDISIVSAKEVNKDDGNAENIYICLFSKDIPPILK